MDYPEAESSKPQDRRAVSLKANLDGSLEAAGIRCSTFCTEECDTLEVGLLRCPMSVQSTSMTKDELGPVLFVI